ncbi:1-acyl-sn-glycerol-3-phosphate acyltransferase [Candidatus Koribacter versatilis Ellin345]|uniref:1-acyl-sn-glycerol-3-phosphate acyltransferase n=1 Tax=Koribacter versatilis (strain Ellin345) TaxID=204669 RepID=Q1IVH5_KORVE|nr:lysophospholipid acyltransferase family protein [Candidatus Koribacter versatilis]ABF39125.1 1-acyl-sn-glycerol-3-phosphate acyltransferase [Candidatus Koribacter versatilis Ellin345]
MPALLSRLRSYFFYVPMVYLYTAIMGAGSLISSLFDRDGRIQHWFARTWSKMILGTASCPVTIINPEKLYVGGAAVYVVNHLSAFDIPTLYAALPFQFRIMAKKELFRYPVLGWHLSRSGQIPIERENARASLKSLMKASDTLKAGTSMVVFPEGGRSPNGQLQPFLGGSFYVAIKAQKPIVPMALIGTYEALPMNSFHIRPRAFQLVIGDAISTAGYAPREMDKLAALAEDAVAELYYSRSTIERPATEPADEALRHAQLTESPEGQG